MVWPQMQYLMWLIFCLATTVKPPAFAFGEEKPVKGPETSVKKHISFPSFDSNNLRILQELKLLGSAKISKQGIQIPDTVDLKHQAGRAIYSSPLRLFDPPTQTPASFHTSFSFQIQNATPQAAHNGVFGGSGLAFIIVPDEFTVGRPGKWLAMINDACDEDSKVVAVEFDTHQNPELGDPSDNHVGINLGTIVSTNTFNASDVGIFLNDGSLHTAWISYDGPRKWMDIRVANSESNSYPSKPLFSGPLDLSPFLKEYMFVGFSASTGNHTQIHTIFSWNFTSTSQAFLRLPSTETCESKILVGKTKSEPTWAFLIFAAVIALALAVLLSMYYNYKWRQEKGSGEIHVFPDKKQRPRPPNKPHRFTFSEISSATRCFNEVEILGSDSRGVYYRGKLSNGCQVAVKRFSVEFLSLQGMDKRRTLKEIRVISRIRHPNLAPVRGWCEEKGEIMVVYDFYPNGSLDKWLFGVGVLPWSRRLKVVRDVAEALSFMHSKQLSHKNVKSSSVFLDVSFRALLGDYGGGMESRKVVSQMVDVFEFGILVLEVVAGRKKKMVDNETEEEKEEEEERELVDYVWKMHEKNEKEKIVDRRMGSKINLEQAVRVLEVGLLCTLNENKGRPCMEQVVEFLNMEGLVPLPQLPPNRPVCLFPYNSTNTELCSGYPILCASFN